MGQWNLADWKSMNLTQEGEASLSSSGSVYLGNFQIIFIMSTYIFHFYDINKVGFICTGGYK